MINKTIMIGLVAVAFVAGSILTGTMAYAAGDKNGKPFEALWTAIHEIELMPGPQGDPGTNGEDGAKGETGADGVPCTDCVGANELQDLQIVQGNLPGRLGVLSLDTELITISDSAGASCVGGVVTGVILGAVSGSPGKLEIAVTCADLRLP